MRLALTVVVLLSACQHDVAKAAPPPSKPAVASPPSAPAGTVGTCEANPHVAGVEDRDQPVATAACPNPMEMIRGNGLGAHTFPKVTPQVTPDWDLPGTRAYACAYACAPAGATAAMLAWSIYEDPRPLRNHNAAFLVTNAAAKKWTVVVMWRHAINLWWNIAGDFHDRVTPIVDFDHSPSVAEIEHVLDANRWTFASSDDGFKLLAGNVIDDNWPGTPPHQYPAGSH